MGPRIGLDSMAKRKFCVYREEKFGRPTRSLMTILTELPRLRALQYFVANFAVKSSLYVYVDKVTTALRQESAL